MLERIRERLRAARSWIHRQYVKAKKAIIGALVSIGLITGTVVLAEDNSLTWNAPTTYEDGTPLPIEELQEFRIYVQVFPLTADLANEARSYEFLDSVEPTSTNYTHTNLTNGIYCYVSTAVATNGAESVYSNEACKTVDERIPSPPGAITVN